jgi:muconolactone D-isomerase
MAYLVRIANRVPPGAGSDSLDQLRAGVRAKAGELKERGVWSDAWHPVGKDEFYCVFRLDSNEELHETLSSLPLYPFYEIEVTPLR